MLKYQHKIFENSKQISYNIVHKVAISGNASEKWFKFTIFVKKKNSHCLSDGATHKKSMTEWTEGKLI